MINIQPITKEGQLEKGDLILLEMKCARVMTKKVSDVLNSGTAIEEIIYSKKKNHYYLTHNLLSGYSHIKNVSKVIQPRSKR